MEILFLIFGIIIGSIAIYFYLKPKLKTVQEYDEKIYFENIKLQEELTNLNNQISILEHKKEIITSSIKEIEEQSENYIKKTTELAEEKIKNSTEKMEQEFQKAQEEASNEYLSVLSDLVEQFQIDKLLKEQELQQVENKLKELKGKVDSAVEAAKRAEELRQKKDFYKLQLSEVDIQEIKKLREVVPDLRDSEPLNKVIWKVYYEKPYTDLVSRVIGNGIHTGIYKITNIENEMCYVGQSANLADRWKQHIKRGIGAEAPTRNKLYPAMLEFGVENFTFEVIEECDRSKLNEREDYWQEYFHAKDFGYSIK